MIPSGKVPINIVGNRCRKKAAVTGGNTNIATTRMTPTASKLATVDNARASIRLMWVAFTGIPIDFAKVESKLVTTSGP